MIHFSLPSFISGARDGMINSWSVDGTCVNSQGAHRNSINCMSDVQSSDNCFDNSVLENPGIITSGGDNIVKVWEYPYI